MDNEQERDTHFQGFAKLLCEEIANLALNLSTEENDVVDGCIICNWSTSKVAEFISPLIAQRAYDLAEHVYNHTTEAMTLFDSFAVVVELDEIPDLTEWPKTASE